MTILRSSVERVFFIIPIRLTLRHSVIGKKMMGTDIVYKCGCDDLFPMDDVDAKEHVSEERDPHKIVQHVPRKIEFSYPVEHSYVPDGLFLMDEEQEEARKAGTPPLTENVIFGQSEEDAEDFDIPEDSITTEVRKQVVGYGQSLPVTIPERFWPRNNPADQEVVISVSSEDESDPPKDASEKRQRELFRQFRAQARSIQPDDDPEKVFGVAAPYRRRYRTAAERNIEPPQLSFSNNASLLIAGSNTLYHHTPT